MTFRQKLLQLIYPIFKLLSNNKNLAGKIIVNNNGIVPSVSFYSLSSILNNGEDFSFEKLKGKNVLIVNTASDCGYTAQYDELEKLYQQLKDKLIILAFPANDFKNQEQSNDEAIAAFCKLNYGITFPLIQKTKVVGNNSNEVFKWLSNEQLNGWCNQQPIWNFSKYLINEKGVLTHFFGPAISPLTSTILKSIQL
ncbi:MAG: glutathione peroxidase [Chitinophagaceae bacterium]|nr:glutathione peroxidase [Chitinophagaceae bacterium]